MKIKIITILLSIVVIVCYLFFDSIFVPINKNNANVDFEIKQGESSSVIASNLENADLVKNATCLDLYMKLSGKYKRIMPGKYQLSDSMNIIKISNIITKKLQRIEFDEAEITIIEGWNLKQIGQYLKEQGFCSYDEWKELINSNNYDYDFIKQKPVNIDLEGYLFPDTYRIYKSSTCSDIVNKLLKNFDLKLEDSLKQEIRNQGKSINEVITMASIIEKEVRSQEDMKIVSGLFWNRIKYNQALESCATLAYIIGENKAQYSFEDTRIKSPYNTYINKGLPPGPINNPGINSIMASVYPKKTDYNYFLTDPKTGNTIFSKTFEEHKMNKAKYLE